MTRPEGHDPDRLIQIGTVGRAHGVAGAVKVAPETDDPARFADLPRLFVGETPDAAAERTVASVRFQYPKGRTVVLLSLAGASTREAAEALRGLTVYAHEDDLPPLADDEVYLHDLIGFAVEDADTGAALGHVADLFDGAQLLFAIDRPGQPRVLLPDVEEFVVATDVPGRRLVVRPPEGLFDATAAAVVLREDAPEATNAPESDDPASDAPDA